MRDERFPYDTLDYARPHVRLVKILQSAPNIICEIITLELPATYIALSYCWGAADVLNTITIVDRNRNVRGPLQVRRNLHTFLDQMAQIDSQEWFWIDAICINQDNVKERGHQVQQMSSVYSLAQEVYVWLGTNPLITQTLRAISFLSKGDLESLGHDVSADGTTDSLWPYVDTTSLAEHPYWSRLWIKQEFLLAKAVQVWSESCMIQWESLETYWDMAGGEDAIQTPFFLSLLDGKQQMSRNEKGRLQLIDLLEIAQDSLCSDPRDQVYGLLGLAEDAEGFTVSYSIEAIDLFFYTLDHFHMPYLSAGAIAVQHALGLGLQSTWRDEWQKEALRDITRSQPRMMKTRAHLLRLDIPEWSDSFEDNPSYVWIKDAEDLRASTGMVFRAVSTGLDWEEPCFTPSQLPWAGYYDEEALCNLIKVRYQRFSRAHSSWMAITTFPVLDPVQGSLTLDEAEVQLLKFERASPHQRRSVYAEVYRVTIEMPRVLAMAMMSRRLEGEAMDQWRYHYDCWSLIYLQLPRARVDEYL